MSNRASAEKTMRRSMMTEDLCAQPLNERQNDERREYRDGDDLGRTSCPIKPHGNTVVAPIDEIRNDDQEGQYAKRDENASNNRRQQSQ